MISTEPLGDVAEFIRGVTFKPGDVNISGVGVMRTKNVQQVLDLSDVMRIPSHLVRRQDQYLREGDILISSANSWSAVGKACWVPRLAEPLAIGGFVTALRCKSENVHARYLYRWFTSPQTQATVRSFGNQTTNISNLNLKLTAAMDVPLPPLAEQRRIAAVLDHTDAGRAKHRLVLNSLDALGRSIFNDMFGSERDHGRIGDLATTTSGGTPDRSVPAYYGGGIPWVKSGELHAGLITTTEETISEEDCRQARQRCSAPGLC